MNARKLKRSHDARSVGLALLAARYRMDGWSFAESVPICCSECHDGDGGCAFPYYGAAPHLCYDTLGLQIGQSQELPEAEWPANFTLDPDAGPATGYPRSGIYTHCLACGAGSAPGGD